MKKGQAGILYLTIAPEIGVVHPINKYRIIMKNPKYNHTIEGRLLTTYHKLAAEFNFVRLIICTPSKSVVPNKI